MLHNLTATRNVEDLFKKVKKSDYIEFAPTKYNVDSVLEICQKYGFLGRHCKKGSTSYKRYGEYVIYITGLLPPNMRVVGTFNPEELVVVHKDKFVKNCKKTELKRKGVLV